MSLIAKKLCIIGDFGVGKTSLIRRYVDRQFSDQYLSTVGVKISRKLIDELSLQLLIWDIEGYTQFKAIAPAYLQGATGAIIVADMTRSETIERLHKHIDHFLSINPQSFVAIALNKADLLSNSTPPQPAPVSPSFKHPQVVVVQQTSAKTGALVNQVFESLSQYLI